MLKVLNMNYCKLTVREIKDALAEYKEFNDPVEQLMSEIMSQYDILFHLCSYTAWYKKNVGEGDSSKSIKTLVKDILNILPEYPE